MLCRLFGFGRGRPRRRLRAPQGCHHVAEIDVAVFRLQRVQRGPTAAGRCCRILELEPTSSSPNPRKNNLENENTSVPRKITKGY